jgi:hypothetical protein
MIYEVVATLRIARDEHDIYTGVIDYGDGPVEPLEGHATLVGLMEVAARRIADELRSRDDADEERRRGRAP